MFEKEAKEYVNEEYDFCYYPDDNLSTRINAERDWQNGAEFGYNKANEWHYVKDGDLPKENKKYWILTSNREPKVDSWLTISWVYSYDVIAWKEIVLPKESE